MANEVVIDIMVDDNVGPGLDSAMAKIAAFRTAVKAMTKDIGNTFSFKLDMGGIDSELSQLKAKLQAHGIADLVDFNLNQGQIDAQLVMLKRKIEQHKIPDLLAINSTQDGVLNLKANIIGLHDSYVRPLYLMATVVGMPGGVVGGGGGSAGAAAAGAAAGSGGHGGGGSGTAAAAAAGAAGGGGGKGGGTTYIGGGGLYGARALRGINTFETGLFGAMPKWMPNWMAVATGIHLVTDGIIELAGVLVPATVAFVAFGAAAAPTLMDMYTRETQLIKASDFLGVGLRGLSGGFQRTAAAVQPEVYVLWGEALATATQKGSEFETMAVGTGNVLDTLGARAEMALGSHGLSAFFKDSVVALSVLGNTGGNILGVLGNLLRPLPGYALLLARGLEGVTGAIETITGTSVFQGIEHVALGFHGMWLYGGLAAGIVGKLVTGGLSGLATGALNASLGLAKMGTRGVAASEGMFKLAGGLETAAGLPWGWILAGATAITVLAVALANAKDGVQQWGADLQSVLNKQPAMKGYTLNLKDQALAMDKLSQSQADLAKANAAPTRQIIVEGQAIDAVSSKMAQAQQNVNDYRSVLQSLQGENKKYTQNVKELGVSLGGSASAQQLLSATGITYGQVATANKRQLAQILIELEAYNLAIHQLAGYGGRYAAATNAMAYSTSDFAKAAQQVVSAEDQVTNTVLGGEQAFGGFITAMKQTGLHAFTASAGFKALNKETQKTYDFWNSLMPASQKLIDSLQTQGISTSQLTTAVATAAKQDMVYAGSNEAARASIVALINNALGPNTVSLKTLNTWVKNNSTSLQGLNSIVAESTIKAGTLAGVLQNDLNAQFKADLLASSGADAAMKKFTDAITHGGTSTTAYHNARQQLITDLENSGLSAKQARGYVDNLQTSINNLHGKTTTVTLDIAGGGKVTVSSSVKNAAGYLEFHAAGGLVGGVGTGTSDSNLIAASKGEYVVNAASTARHLPLLEAINAKRMATGGLVGGELAGVVPWGSARAHAFGLDRGKSFGTSTMNAFISGEQALIAAAMAVAGGGSASANAALARRMYPAYGSGAEWAAWNYVAMRESGWNQYARNPGSGAYGIPQALPYTKLPFAGQPGGGSHPGPQISWMMNYMLSRYGGPIGAMIHERNYGWYGDGLNGIISKPTLIGVGDGGPEHVSVTPMWKGNRGNSAGITLVVGTSGGQGTFDQFLFEWIQKNVRIRGGGDVQVAFGQ